MAERIVTAVEGMAEFPKAGGVVLGFDKAVVRERPVHCYRVINRIRGRVVDVVTIYPRFSPSAAAF